MPDRSQFEEQEYLTRERRTLWGSVHYLGKQMEEVGMSGVIIEQVVIQAPTKTGGDYRAILKGKSESGEPFVDFVGGGSVPELMNNIAAKGRERGFNWREDKPWPGKVAAKSSE